MPQEKMQFMNQSKLMTAEEIETLAKIFVQHGVNKIRLTGGEPLVRKDFEEIVRRLAALPVELMMTTNGILLKKNIYFLKESGFKSINVSLDTLKPDKFLKITRRNAFSEVWDNILLLVEEGFRVKINAVAVKDFVEEEFLDFIALTEKLPLHIRFIEFMPFRGNQWSQTEVFTAQQMLQITQERFDIVKLKDEPNSTAKKYKVIGAEGTFAFITTMSEIFCSSCNRLRITADGKIKNCLFGKEEFDFLKAMRAGENIEEIIRLAVIKKFAAMGGQFTNGYKNISAEQIENRSMVTIGG
jgi:cyclic pyranopterin phosphate synthase